MALKIGLTLYGLGHRGETGKDTPRPARPAGQLVWLHAPDAAAAPGLRELARRLWLDDGTPCLITCPDPLPDLPGTLVQPPPPDTPAEARAFLDHWRPDLGLFTEGELRPALVGEAAKRHVPLLMADAEDAAASKGPRRLVSGGDPGRASALSLDRRAGRSLGPQLSPGRCLALGRGGNGAAGRAFGCT
ncbi:hypothetical protein MASR1M32_43390 [Rhodobacter sp.]